jgi:hypothetical protein
MAADSSTSLWYAPASSAADLHAAIADAVVLFSAIDDATSLARLRPDGWCVREIVGHLIDSACNNHRRFVIGQSGGVARFDGYLQDEWVARQRYAGASWSDLVALWTAYNRHLRHLMQHTTPEAAAMSAVAPDGAETVTLGFLMHDYVRHLRQHLDQVKTIVARR